MLSGLRQLFSVERVDRLVLTSEEYYAPRHFPTLRCDVASPSTLVARVAAARPGAVIASVVSWRGAPLPVSALFGEIRRVLGARTPLLVADYTHAGAIGFPPVSALNADVVSGDAEKWLLPARQRSRLAFLWMRSPAVFRSAARSFSPFFLAVDGRTDARSARWLDPQEVRDRRRVAVGQAADSTRAAGSAPGESAHEAPPCPDHRHRVRRRRVGPVDRQADTLVARIAVGPTRSPVARNRWPHAHPLSRRTVNRLNNHMTGFTVLLARCSGLVRRGRAIRQRRTKPTGCTRIGPTWPAPGVPSNSGRQRCEKIRPTTTRCGRLRAPTTGSADTSRKRSGSTALEDGVARGRAAVSLAPTRPEGHFWMAANMGALAELSARAGLKYRKTIKEELETVLRLDAAFLQGSADRALGRWYFKVPRLFGGSKKSAEEHLRASLEVRPEQHGVAFLPRRVAARGRPPRGGPRRGAARARRPDESRMGAGESGVQGPGAVVPRRFEVGTTRGSRHGAAPTARRGQASTPRQEPVFICQPHSASLATPGRSAAWPRAARRPAEAGRR